MTPKIDRTIGYVRIFTTSQAAFLGVSPDDLRGPRYRRLLHGVYCPSDHDVTRRDLADAALLACPDATVTGLTALQLRGLDYGDDVRVHLASTRRIRRPEIRSLIAARHPVGGVCDVVTATVDACRGLTPVDQTVLLDRLLHRKMLRVEQLTSAPLVGILGARWARVGAESPQESRLRLVMREVGLPEPSLQHVIRDAGAFVGRADMAWEDYWTIAEYEGAHHATDSRQWATDIGRYERMASLGWRVVRVTSAHMYAPDDVVARVAEALRAGGWTGSRRQRRKSGAKRPLKPDS